MTEDLDMRTYVPDYTDIGISRERYRELISFCRQYPEWKAEASSLLGVSAVKYSDMPTGSGVGDPVFRTAVRREKLISKIELVEHIADMIDGGQWRPALIQNICLGKALKFIDQTLLPTSRRDSFFKARRAFFVMLNERMNEIEYSRGTDTVV